jgi:hypothetical protein
MVLPLGLDDTQAIMLISLHPARRHIGTLRTLYVHRAARALALSLNDPGRLGVVTRALLRVQGQYAGGLPVHQFKRESRFYTTRKQLALIREAGLELTDKGQQYIQPRSK